MEGSPSAVADPQVGAVDGEDPAVGVAQAVGALPAGELQGLGEADAGAGGLRPGGEVGERLADDLFAGWPKRSAASSFQRVMTPPRSTWTTATRTRSSATGRSAAGSSGPGGAGAGGALGQVELEPDVLVGGGVLDAPAGGERGAQQQAAAALVVRVAERPAGGPGAGPRVRGSGRRPRRARRLVAQAQRRRRRCRRARRRW